MQWKVIVLHYLLRVNLSTQYYCRIDSVIDHVNEMIVISTSLAITLLGAAGGERGIPLEGFVIAYDIIDHIFRAITNRIFGSHKKYPKVTGAQTRYIEEKTIH